MFPVLTVAIFKETLCLQVVERGVLDPRNKFGYIGEHTKHKNTYSGQPRETSTLVEFQKKRSSLLSISFLNQARFVRFGFVLSLLVKGRPTTNKGLVDKNPRLVLNEMPAIFFLCLIPIHFVVIVLFRPSILQSVKIPHTRSSLLILGVYDPCLTKSFNSLHLNR